MLNNFKNEELVKVQGRMFPVVGGRLRLAHEDNANLSIETKVISYDTEVAIIHAMVKTEKGVFNGLGNASVKRDRVLSKGDGFKNTAYGYLCICQKCEHI